MLYIGKEYFKGYEEKFIRKKNGRGFKKVRVYLGDVYHPTASVGRWIAKKALFGGLIILFFGILLWGGMQRNYSNSNIFVTLPYAIGLMSGGYCALGVFHFIVTKFNMTAYEYDEFRKQVTRGSAVAMYALTVAVAADVLLILYWCVTDHSGDFSFVREALTLFANLLCALIMFALNMIEKRAGYTVIPGKHSEEEDESENS